MKLTDREWKEFFIDDVFDVSGTITTKPQDLISGGSIPRITCASTNNGLDNLYQNKPTEKGKVITIDSATIGFTAYQGYDFIATDHVEKIKLKSREMNCYIGLFLKQTIDSAIMQKYNYGYKFSQTRIKKQKILLPVDKQGQPDYQFMEDYIKQLMHQKRKEYIEYANKKIEEKRREEIEPLDSKQWREFNIAQLFDIYSGKRLESYNQQSGNIPFIGATDSNNGITNFVSNTNSSLDKNVLGVNYNGSVVCNYYHSYKCIFSDDVKRFHLKNKKDRKDILLFFSTIIYQQREKYRYAYKFNAERMKRQYIMLPTNKNNEPDYEYMEDYIQNIIFNKYNDYIQYSNQKIQSLTN